MLGQMVTTIVTHDPPNDQADRYRPKAPKQRNGAEHNRAADKANRTATAEISITKVMAPQATANSNHPLSNTPTKAVE